MIKVVIFDCFGVLLIDHQQSLIERFPEHQAAVARLSGQADRGILDHSELLNRYSSLLGVSSLEIERQFQTEHQINTELVEYLHLLKSSGYRLALLSNLGKGWFDQFLTDQTVRRLFEAVVLSGEVGFVKPELEIYRYALEKLACLADEVVFIDDRQENCDGAEVLGIKAVLYQNVEETKEALKKLGVSA